MTQFDRSTIDTWIDRASHDDGGDESGLILSVFTEDEKSTIAADIEGLYEGAIGIVEEIHRLIESIPSSDILETNLVNIEISLAHGRLHWGSLVRVLRSKDQWMEDDIGEGFDDPTQE